jgi:predicted Zn-dependent protease
VRYREFALDLAETAAAAGRLDAAQELVIADLAVAPQDLRAAKVLVEITRRRGTWRELVPRLERTIRARLRDGDIPLALQLDYAEALLRAGDRERGERVLDRLANEAPGMAAAVQAIRESVSGVREPPHGPR